MKNFLLITITVATLFKLTAKDSKAQSFNPQLAAMLQDTLNYYVSAITNIKGMSASVYLPGQGIWQGTAGVSYSGHPITHDMGFGIASNTKLFVATAMLILAENHIISLNDSLHKWLPVYPNVNPNITIRQLLNHTTGVQDPIFLSPWMDTIMKNPTRVFAPTEVLSWVGAPLFAPGTGWSYSNVNYILAGMVAQSATGFHISKIIRDSILTPLNLGSTFYDVKEPEIGTIAHRWYNSVDYNDTSRVGLNTAGGCAGSLFSTSADMVKWYHALMSGQVLSSASFAELTNFIATPTSYTYGLALENQAFFGHTTWGHGGVTWGYKSRMVYDPCSGAAVCGLVNSWPAGNDGVTILLYSVLVNHLPGCGAIITGPVTVCQGQNNIIYSVPPIANATSYVWTLPGGATGTSSTNSIAVSYGGSAVSGTVTVKGTNLYGDGAVSSLQVIVNSLPNAAINPSGTTVFCSGGSVVLNATVTSNRTYQWKKAANLISGATLSSYTATTGGKYRVIVTNTVSGCSKTTATATIVTINTLPSATITPHGPTTFCAGGSVVLAANGGTGLTYKWKKGNGIIGSATMQNYIATTNGTYEVIVTNAN
ncbi:MAG: serine hydrolase, partial [Bacteroidota bacterium]